MSSQFKDLASERAILGCIILDNNIISLTRAQKLCNDDLSDEKHRAIFTAMCEMCDKEEPIDEVTLLSRLGNGYASLIASLQDQAISTANVKSYINTVMELSDKRRAWLSAKAAQEALLAGAAASEAIALVEPVRHDSTGGHGVGDAMRDAMREIERRYELKGKADGVTTGIEQLDSIYHGFRPGELHVLAARPGCGKSALALQIGMHASAQGYKVSIISLEMSIMEIALRMLSSQGRIDGDRLTRGMLVDADWSRLGDAVDKITGQCKSLRIYDDGVATLDSVKSVIESDKPQLLIVDYLQLMHSPNLKKNGTREQEVSAITRGLKLLAQKHKIVVLCLSQLRRLDARKDQRPQLSDLRESGAIEQDANSVIFIYRDELINPETQDKGVAEIIVSKNRRGRTASLKSKFIGEYVRFENL